MASLSGPAAAPVERTLDAALARKLDVRGANAYAPISVATAQERLETFLRDEADEPGSVSDIRRLTGGASAEQFVFTLDRGDGPERMVLRLDPPAQLLPTDRRREFEVLRALDGTLPVPTAHFVADHTSAFGTGALITSFDRGVAAPTGVVGKATGLSTAYGAHRAALAPQYVDHLAALHRLDTDALDLPSFDRPAAGTTAAVDLRIALWDRVWAEDTYEAHPTIALTSRWLWEHRPTVERLSVVHGDYRNGNFLFDEASDEITVILDWENAHLGDRHEDLAYLMLPGYGHPADDGTYLCAGLIGRDEFVARYERASGLPVDPDRLRYYTVLNMYWAVIACCATAPRVAGERMTHNGPMMNFVPGLGAFFTAELNKILREET